MKKLISHPRIVLAILLSLATRQAYVLGFQCFYALPRHEAYLNRNLIWFAAGPASFFLGTTLGFLFCQPVATTRDRTTSQFWKVALWLPITLLALGTPTFVLADISLKSFPSTVLEHAQAILLVALPMMIAVTCLREILARPSPEFRTNFPARLRGRWQGAILLVAKILAGLSLVAGSLLAVAASALLMQMASCTPPTLPALAQRFPATRADLRIVVEMADHDPEMSVIDPEWLNTTTGLQTDRVNKTPVGISAQRWDEYRRIFKRADLSQGIRRYKGAQGDSFLIVESVGMAGSGYSNGYLHCGLGPAHAYPACTSNKTQDDHADAKTGESYAYIKLAPGWYAYSDRE